MAVRVASFAFDGIEARNVDVQVQLSGAGTQVFNIVGLPDKAVRESQERVRAAFAALGLDLHMGRTAVNVAGQALIPTIVAKRQGILDQDRYDSTTTIDVIDPAAVPAAA